jgi:hypothetical protein
MNGTELLKRLDRGLQILVRVQSGYDQNEWPSGAFQPPLANLKELRIDAMRNRGNLTRRPGKGCSKIPRGIVRNGDQSTGTRRGAGKQHVPERKIPGAKELGM